jgi:hypothetical protein
MEPLLRSLIAILLATASTAQAETPMPFTYEQFEMTVPHVDLAVCPTELAGPDRFCRLTSHQDSLNVFVFSEAGDQPLVALKSWSADLLAGLMD